MANLLDKYKDLLNPIQQGLSNVAQFNNRVSTAANNAFQSSFNPFSQQFQQRNQQFSNFAKSLPEGSLGGNVAQGLEGIRSAVPGMGFAFKQPVANEPVTVQGKMSRLGGAFIPALTTGGVMGQGSFGASALRSLPEIGFAGGLGAGFSAVTGGDPFKGATAGLNAYTVSKPISVATNPLIDKFVGKSFGLSKNPYAQILASRSAAGLGNIPQGMAINAALGQPYTPTDLGIDAVTGFAFGEGHNPSLKNDLAYGEQGLKNLGQDITQTEGAYKSIFDKKWRKEISDSVSKINEKELDNLSLQGTTALGDLLKHSPLYKAYPEFRMIKVEIDPTYIKQDIRGSFNPAEGKFSIKLNPDVGNVNNVKSTLLHEIQHAIQTVEGFSKGGNPDIKSPEFLDWVHTNYGDVKDKDALGELSKKYYLNLLGEIESGAVQNRMNLTPSQLTKSDPLAETMRVRRINPRDVIVDTAGNGSQSLVDPLINEARKYKSAEEFVRSLDLTKPGSGNSNLSAVSKEIEIENFGDKGVFQSPRTERNSQAIKSWENKIKAGEHPVIITGGKGFPTIIDGVHRLEAYKNLGFKKVPTVFESDLTSIWNQANQPMMSMGDNIQVNPQELNVNKLGIDEASKAQVKEISANDVTTRLTNDEIVDLAKRSGFDTRSHSITDTSKKIAEQLNSRRRVVELQTEFNDLKSQGASKLDLEKKMREISQQAKLSASQGTDIARQLQARKIIANEIDTPMQKVFKLLENAGVNEEIYTSRAVNVDFNNPQEVVKFYRDLVPAKFGDWMDALRYNSMLSSPNTHINNIFSNLAGSGFVAPMEKALTGTLDFFRSKATGTERQAFAGEGVAYTKGYLQNVNNAMDKLVSVFKGTQEIQNLDTAHMPIGATGVKGKVLAGLELPMKALEGMDQFFTALTAGGERSAMEYRASKGVKVPDMLGQAEDNAKYRLFRQGLTNPDQGTVLNAVDAFTQTLQRLRNHNNPIVSQLTKYTLPFVQTPMNIFKQGLEYSPAGFSTMYGAANKTEQASKAILGTVSMLGAATLLGAGRLTWAEPTDAKKKAAFRDAGMQPYAVKIGDNWVSYQKLPPLLAFNLALVSALDDAQKNSNLSDGATTNILSALSKYGNFLADQSYVKSMGDLLASVKGDSESKARILGNYGQQLVPYRALGGWLARLTDDTQRKVDTDALWVDQQMQQLLMNIPGLSQMTPARLNDKGEPIENQNRVLNAFSPMKVTTEKSDKKMIYDTMVNKTASDKADRQVKDQMKAQGQTTTQGGKAYYKDGDNVNTLDYSKFDKKPTNQIEKIRLERDRFKEATKVYRADGTGDVDKQSIIDKLGVNYNDVVYYDVASDTTDVKKAMIDQVVQGSSSHNELLTNLIKMSRVVGGSKILTDELITYLGNEGYLNANEKKALKNIDYTGATPKMKKTTSTKKAKQIKVSLPKLKLTTATPTRRKPKYSNTDISNFLKVDVSRLKTAKKRASLLSA